jgi:hypothetical protein
MKRRAIWTRSNMERQHHGSERWHGCYRLARQVFEQCKNGCPRDCRKQGRESRVQLVLSHSRYDYGCRFDRGLSPRLSVG